MSALGQLALTWNGMHETMSLLYCTIITQGEGPVNQHLAVWHAIKSDRSQRDMLKAAANEHLFSGFPVGFPEDVIWLCKMTDVLEETRNNAIHTPLWSYQRSAREFIVMPVVGLGHVRARKLFEKNLLEEFRWCRDQSLALAHFAAEMDKGLTDLTTSWPKRPAWPNRRETAKKTKAKP